MKNIVLQIPSDKILPTQIKNFTPEENYRMLEIGASFIIEGTKQISSHIIQDVLQEKQNELENLKQSLIQQYEQQHNTLENLYKTNLETNEVTIETLKRELETQNEKNKEFEEYIHTKFSTEYKQKSEIMEIKFQKEKEFFEKERERNDKTLEKLHELIKVSSSTKTAVKLGIEGENIFQEMAHKAFRDFDSFCLKYTGDQTSKGDYHLFFRDFSVLVDTKNYSGNVSNASKKKFKFDMENNKHMKIAWLVSMNSNIDCFDKYPIMFEMLGEQCVFYVNNLLKYEEPIEMLRLLWSISNNINTILSKQETGEEEFKEYKTKIEGIIRELEKITKEENLIIIEMTKYIDKLKQNKKVTKDFLVEMLNNKINNDINTEYQNVLQEQLIDSVRNWCTAKLHIIPDSKSVMKYADIWEKFEKDVENRRFNIKKMKFKEFIMDIYKERITKKSGDIIGIEWITEIS